MENNQINNQESKKILKALLKERESVSELRDEINKDYKEMRISNINQRRDFFKHITILSGAILGLLSFIKTPINEYFIIGVILNVSVIIFILFYIRETLDKEGTDLLRQQDRYNESIEKKIQLIDKYLNTDKITKETVREYLKELQLLPGRESLLKEFDELFEKRKKRLQGSLSFDFSGEFIVFLFVTASFFVIISLFQYRLSLIWVLLAILLIFCITFMDCFTFIMKFISKFGTFLKLKIFKIKK